MKRSIRVAAAAALILALCTVCAFALAENVFRFTDRSITLFEGETYETALTREGLPADEGILTYTVGNERVLAVDGEGKITGIKKGQSTLKATLKQGRRAWTANVTVTVVRRVTAVTLNTTKLKICRATDPEVSGLLRQATEHDVIIIPAGKTVELKATCTPSDANNRKVLFTSSDEGVLKAGTGSARGLQAGECELTVSSVQNPEITQVFHVIVTQPVTGITLSAPEGKSVDVGSTIPLEAVTAPASASIQGVEWRSRNEQVLRVDADGNVTGVKRGSAAVEAKALDGSGKTETITITVTQPVTRVTIRESEITLATRQNGYLHATADPENANDRSIVWSSSDERIAQVNSNGQVQGITRGECVITAASRSNPEVKAEVPVKVIQRVTAITFPGGQVSMPIRTSAQLSWIVEPSDATIQDVTFSSSNRNVATVDANGLVTGHTRGSATITAAATDGSNRRGQVRVIVTQPVEGVSIQYGVYHVQLERSLNIKALIQPSNANNQNVHFTMGDDYIATVTDHKNIGRVRGWHPGTTTITGTTEDGGYSASAEVRVGDFNRAIVVDDLYIEHENIRITLRNRSDFTVDRVYFTIETYDQNGEPLVCNTDGVSNSFEGKYPLEIGPGEISMHYEFFFGDYVQPLYPIGTVTITITGWRDTEGYTRNIPEEDRPTQTFRRFFPPVPTQVLDGYGAEG